MPCSGYLCSRLFESKTFNALDGRVYTHVSVVSRCGSDRIPDFSRIVHIAFMNRGTAISNVSSGLPKIHDVFDDWLEVWIGYPLTRSAVTHRPTLYLRERCRLAALFQDMHDLILASDKLQTMTIRKFASTVDCLLEDMQHWYQHLLFELHYQWPMSVAVWESQYVN
jgi:hypothetical protein